MSLVTASLAAPSYVLAQVVTTADTGNFQGEMNAIWDHLFPAPQSEAIGEDAAVHQKIKQMIAELTAHPVKK